MTDCASCADERSAGAAFCEACGRPLASSAELAPPGEACPNCGAPGGVGADGYCENCGILAAVRATTSRPTAAPSRRR